MEDRIGRAIRSPEQGQSIHQLSVGWNPRTEQLDVEYLGVQIPDIDQWRDDQIATRIKALEASLIEAVKRRWTLRAITTERDFLIAVLASRQSDQKTLDQILPPIDGVSSVPVTGASWPSGLGATTP